MTTKELLTHINEQDNQKWYVQLLGKAMESVDDAGAAVRIADEAYRKRPFPPLSDTERAMAFSLRAAK